MAKMIYVLVLKRQILKILLRLIVIDNKKIKVLIVKNSNILKMYNNFKKIVCEVEE